MLDAGFTIGAGRYVITSELHRYGWQRLDHDAAYDVVGLGGLPRIVGFPVWPSFKQKILLEIRG